MIYDILHICISEWVPVTSTTSNVLRERQEKDDLIVTTSYKLGRLLDGQEEPLDELDLKKKNIHQ